MRIAFEQQAVLERAGLHLVGIADEILGCGASSPIGTKLHFCAGRKTRAAAPAQVRLLHCRHDFACGAMRTGLAQRRVAARLLVLREIRRFFSRRDVTGQRCFHRQALFFPFFLSGYFGYFAGFRRSWQDPGPGRCASSIIMAGAWSQAPRHTFGSRVKRPSAVVSPSPIPSRACRCSRRRS